MSALACNHCGCEAIDHADNVYTDGEGERCATCDFPGHVVVDWEPGYDDEATAYWSVSEDERAVCCEADCDECAPRRKVLP